MNLSEFFEELAEAASDTEFAVTARERSRTNGEYERDDRHGQSNEE